MKSAFRLTAIVLSSAALFLAGCAKKPLRSNPSETMFGPGSVSSSAFDPSEFDTMGDALPGRGGAFDASNQQRGLLPSVFFDFDSAAVRVSERAKLSQAADYLNSNAGARLLLEGHCDWRGTTEYNMGLGDRRAIAVRDFLATLGIAASRVDTVSKGDLEAVESGSEAQMQNDRRVEVIVVR